MVNVPKDIVQDVSDMQKKFLSTYQTGKNEGQQRAFLLKKRRKNAQNIERSAGALGLLHSTSRFINILKKNHLQVINSCK